MLQQLPLAPNPLKNDVRPGIARNWDGVPPELRKLLANLCEGKLPWPLFLYGRVGTGKTSAALCVFDRVAKARFWSMPELVSTVTRVNEGRELWYNGEAGTGGTWTEDGWWRHFGKLPFVVVDDIGLREVESDHQMETLYQALENRGGRPTIYTSNLNAQEIEDKYNDRIRSRICAGTVYELRGQDRRAAVPAESF